MIGIIIALKKEAASIVNEISDAKHSVIAKKDVYEGTIHGKKVVLAISGIGKVNAALTTQILIDKYNVNYVINVGTAGGYKDVKVKEYYVASSCMQFDFDLRDLDKVPLGYIQDYDTVFFDTDCSYAKEFPTAKVATADRFTESKKDDEEVLASGCTLRDMEAGAIAETCRANDVPLCVVKGITDVKGSGLNGEQFYSNLTTVCNGFADVVKKILSSIGNDNV